MYLVVNFKMEVKVKVKNGSHCEVESVYFGSRKEPKERKDDSRVEVEIIS